MLSFNHNLIDKGYDEDGKNKVAIQRVGGAVIPAVNVYPITSELKGESDMQLVLSVNAT